MAVRPSILFPSPPLEFRTAGFPQYGFKPDSPAATFAQFRLIGGQQSFRSSSQVAQGAVAGHRPTRGRGPFRLSGPEALGSPAGYAVPPGRRLLWPHPRLWASPADLWLSPAGLCLAAKTQSFPALSCVSVFPCRLPYPGGPGGHDCCTSARGSLRPSARDSASAMVHLNRFMWSAFRGCRVRLMLRPGNLLALHRQGRLLSSFHPMSHLSGTSNITTRRDSQLPRPDLHRQDTQPYRLRRREPRGVPPTGRQVGGCWSTTAYGRGRRLAVAKAEFHAD